MSLTLWIVSYLALAAFLAWIAWGRGLESIAGGVLATLVLDGLEPKSDRGLRRAAVAALVVATALFAVGVLDPEWRWLGFLW